MASQTRVEILPADDASLDAEIEAFFSDCPASFLQQTPAWRDVILGLGEDEALVLGCRSGGRLVGVLPAYRFEGPLGAVLNSCVQAGPLGGVACAPDADRDAVYGALLGAFVELAKERDCAVASVLTNPFWPDRELCERLLQPDFALDNQCQALDLARCLDADGELRWTDPKLRYNLRRAESGPLRADEAQTPENVAAWHRVHATRARELGIPALPERMFQLALERLVPSGRARFFFARATDGDEIVAGAFCVGHGRVVDFVIASGDREHARARSNYLVALLSIRWAASRGARYFNWQGSPPQGGVYDFKRGWGSADHDYAYLTAVTGDAERILSSSVEAVREGYRWHYVVPFDRIGAGAGSGARSTRASAYLAEADAS